MAPWHSFLCLTILVFLLIDLLIGHCDDLLISVHLSCAVWVLTHLCFMHEVSFTDVFKGSIHAMCMLEAHWRSHVE